MARPYRNRKRRGGQTEIRQIQGPGSLQGGDFTTAWANDRTFDGADETISEGMGLGSFELLRGPFRPMAGEMAGDERLNRAERRFIRRQAGAIVETDSQGFVSVEWYEDDIALNEAWGELESAIEDFEVEQFFCNDN